MEDVIHGPALTRQLIRICGDCPIIAEGSLMRLLVVSKKSKRKDSLKT
jgi:hypothetical protein